MTHMASWQNVAVLSLILEMAKVAGHVAIICFSYLDVSLAMACYCLGIVAGGGGHENYSTAVWEWKKRKQMMRMKVANAQENNGKLHSFSDFLMGFRGAASRSTMVVTCSSNKDGDDSDRKKRPTDMVTFSSKISTDVPLYEPPGVSFCEYIKDRPRIFRAMFADKSRSHKLDDEEWRIQMLPIRFLFASVNPVIDMSLRCKSDGKGYPSNIPLHVTRILELQATRWELKGLEGIYVPSHFDLNVQGILYSVRKGSRSRLKGHLEISISLVLPPALALVPMDVLKAVAESVLTRLVKKMKQEVDAGLLSDFSNFGREMLANHSQPISLPAVATTVLDADP